MSLLPDSTRILLGPGPSVTSPRVMRAMAAPTLGPVPEGIDEAGVRKHLLDELNIEIGAGLGPLAGKIWRVGLMGAGSSPQLIVLLRGALERALAHQRLRVTV